MYMIPLVLVGLVLILLFRFLRRNYGSLEQCGFPVIPPILCFGSGPFLLHKTSLIKLDQDRFAKYGKVYGAYLLSTPFVFISDPDIIKQITVKDFDSFQGHDFTFENQKYRSIDTTIGQEWRELRKGLSPIFTSGKIKSMMKLVDGVLDNMMNYLEKEIAKSPVIDMKPVFQCMTMDVIGKCAFGMDLNCFKDPTNTIFTQTKEIMQDFRAKDLKSSLMLNMEMGMKGIEKMIDFTPATMKYVWNVTRKIQEQREKENIEYGDFIDKLKELKDICKNGVVTEDQLTAQGIIFLVAGFETSASTLSSLSYFLVKNPEVYDTLLAEVDENLEKHEGKVNHETVAEMPYLEGCIKESLRMLPPVARNDRLCNKDWSYKGISIKKGTSVGIPVYVVHHNPEYWPEPELFQPQRFFKENLGNIVPGSYIPFGYGPRACIGERFAMTEMKIGMVRLLKQFHLRLSHQTRLNMMNGDLALCSYSDMFIKIVPRH